MKRPRCFVGGWLPRAVGSDRLLSMTKVLACLQGGYNSYAPNKKRYLARTGLNVADNYKLLLTSEADF